MRTRLKAMIAAAALIVAALPGALPAVAAQPTDLFISEYVEGVGSDKAIEIYNGTGSMIDLGPAGYGIEIYANGSTTATSTIPLTGSIADGEVHVLVIEGSSALFGVADQFSAALTFTGNDAVVLRRLAGGPLIDIFGQIGVDPGIGGWGSGEQVTANRTLVRKPSITTGRSVNASFEPTDEWSVLGFDFFDGLGFHTIDETPPDPTAARDTGVVGADVTVPSSATCIELSTTAVSFGTQRFGTDDVAAEPIIVVTNCSGITANLFARGTDATGSGATWHLVNDASACAAGTRATDDFHLKVRNPAQPGVVIPLTKSNTVLPLQLPGGFSEEYQPVLDMPCPGSSGAGQTMGMQVVFVVTEAE
jgi:uncharacterized protein